MDTKQSSTNLGLSHFFFLGGGGGEGGAVWGSTVWQSLQLPFNTTSNFTFIHVYPCLNLHVSEEILGYFVGIASHPRYVVMQTRKTNREKSYL